ncbi:MAG: tRNA (adenosine(37)-N6)-threonylcarbamoyltransferase complex dimerization subunit type 1 TsaB [Deltaproteobacteria bacterium]|nr:tRNA (adenosine(37)-N6)-threonylcarbamoyltransferase complex dimerization subunit type 1 TsaB [Deltaproteobacteria bacterium]
MIKNILAIDTSTPRTFVAFYTDSGTLVERSSSGTTSHSEELAELVQQAIGGGAAAGLRALVIGSGPGSFTGLRIGYSFLKGVSFALQIPLCSVCSLEGMAREAPANAALIACASDARRGELFTAFFRRNNEGRLVREPVAAILGYPEAQEKLKRMQADYLVPAPQVAVVCDSDQTAGHFEAVHGWTIQRTAALAAQLAGIYCEQQPNPQPYDLAALACQEPTYVRPVAARTITERMRSSR